MATANGVLSDDDELFVNGSAAEPPPFTFQSYLSSDDEADPLTLDEIAKVSLAALQNGTLASPPDEENVPPPAAEDGQAGGIQTNGIAETSAEESANESTEESIKESRKETIRESGKESTKESTERSRTRIKLIGIEVRLPWLPPAQRARYQKVRVEDYRPDDGHRTRRRRRRVSYPRVLLCRLCFGDSILEAA
jgi:chromodomain-helicase-DNA-binding protein 4